MHIRYAVISDIWVIAKVHVRSWQHAYRGLLDYHGKRRKPSACETERNRIGAEGPHVLSAHS